MSVPTETEVSAQLQRLCVLHSLSWFVAANGVGVLLAILLLYPELNSFIVPYTYGRWIPLHIDFQLYGWCALPLFGLINHFFLPRDTRGVKLVSISLNLWTTWLLISGFAWLHGYTSGKLFLDWVGVGRILFPGMLLIHWLILLVGFLMRLKSENVRLASAYCLHRMLVLSVLLLVPGMFWIATDPTVFPAINPLSSGATGTSLLGSVLGIVLIILLLPWMSARPKTKRTLIGRIVPFALAIHFLIFVLLDHGNVSNRPLSQIIGLGSVMLWIPWIMCFYRQYQWPTSTSRWFKATMFWALILSINGIVIFLPSVLPYVKFTNMLVAHAHIAMAGLLSCLNFLLLLLLAPESRLSKYIYASNCFWYWNIGLVVMLFGLTSIGFLEIYHQSYLFRTHPSVQIGSLTRLVGGVIMFVASGLWLHQSLRIMKVGCYAD